MDHLLGLTSLPLLLGCLTAAQCALHGPTHLAEAVRAISTQHGEEHGHAASVLLTGAGLSLGLSGAGVGGLLLAATLTAASPGLVQASITRIMAYGLAIGAVHLFAAAVLVQRDPLPGTAQAVAMRSGATLGIGAMLYAPTSVLSLLILAS